MAVPKTAPDRGSGAGSTAERRCTHRPSPTELPGRRDASYQARSRPRPSGSADPFPEDLLSRRSRASSGRASGLCGRPRSWARAGPIAQLRRDGGTQPRAGPGQEFWRLFEVPRIVSISASTSPAGVATLSSGSQSQVNTALPSRTGLTVGSRPRQRCTGKPFGRCRPLWWPRTCRR